MPRGRRWVLLLLCLCLCLGGPGRARALASVPCAGQDGGVARYAPALWQAACAVWAQTVDLPEGLIVPSRAYAPQVWTRDAFWTALATGDARLSARLLVRLAMLQAPSGQVPTWFVPHAAAWPARRARAYFGPDESTLLYLIWAGALQRRMGAAWEHSTTLAPVRPALQRALGYLVAGLSAQGAYVSPLGSDTSWEDGRVLPRPDVLAYTQGLAVVALLAAQRLGLAVDPAVIARAAQAERALARPWPDDWAAPMQGGRALLPPALALLPSAVQPHAYLPFSARLPERDPSVLAGPFLGLWLFGQAIVPGSLILDTVASLCGSPFGYRTSCPPDGGYLDPLSFRVPRAEGDYQNGGTWVLYDALALGAAALAGAPGARAAFWVRASCELAGRAVLREYRQTDPHLPYYGAEPVARDGYGWDTFLVTEAALLGPPVPPGNAPPCSSS